LHYTHQNNSHNNYNHLLIIKSIHMSKKLLFEISEVTKPNGDIFFHILRDGHYVSSGCFYAGTQVDSERYRESLAEARIFVDKLLAGATERKKTIWSVEVDDQDESTDD